MITKKSVASPELASTTSICGDCPKISSQKYKCCTYWPLLPNYLVGAVLAQQASSSNITSSQSADHKVDWIENCEPTRNKLTDFDIGQIDPTKNEVLSSEALSLIGALQILELIKDLKFALPYGLCPPPAYQIQFMRLKAQFGSRKELLCPFYSPQVKACSIWPQRSQECRTYFCSKTPQAKQKGHWDLEATRQFDLQNELAQEFMLQKGYSPREIQKCLHWSTPLFHDSSPIGPQRWSLSVVEDNSLWLHHRENKLAFYKACWQLYCEKTATQKNGPLNAPSSSDLQKKVIKY